MKKGIVIHDDSDYRFSSNWKVEMEILGSLVSNITVVPFSDEERIIEEIRIFKQKGNLLIFQEDSYHKKNIYSSSCKDLLIHWTTQKFNVSDSSQIEERKIELLKAINTLQACLDDPTERHIQYFRFKELLKETRDNIDSKYWDLLRLIVGCLDATTNIKAVDLDLSKIEAFKAVINQINIYITCSETNALLETLISAGLKPVPDLQNLESIEI